MRKANTLLALFLIFSQSHLIYTETIKVGGYIFPPFLEENDSGFYGLTIDLLHEMNAIQDEYEFTFVETTAKRRYDHFLDGSYDMILL